MIADKQRILRRYGAMRNDSGNLVRKTIIYLPNAGTADILWPNIVIADLKLALNLYSFDLIPY